MKMLKRRYFRFSTLRWVLSGFKSPSPQWVKIKLLLSQMIPGATWLETGTYLGDTTVKLARKSKFIITIEPSKELFDFAKWRMRKKKNVRVVLGTSEEFFQKCLLEVETQSLNIWLDGHYSGDVTYKGSTSTPILSELTAISKVSDRFNAIKVFVDDIRCFYHDMGEENDYPGLQFLIDWARESGFNWHIEQDIFIAESIFGSK